MQIRPSFGVVLLAAVLAANACNSGEIGATTPSAISDDELSIFLSSVARDGSIQSACQDLKTLCSAQKRGCGALATFCQPATDDRACTELQKTCVTGHSSACTTYQQHCSSSAADGGAVQPTTQDASTNPQRDVGANPVHDSGTNPTPTGHFSLLPVGSALPSGADCAARVRRSSWEPRPQNNTANHTTGIKLSVDSGIMRAAFASRIDGQFTGTTDEIIQWGACKWGFDEDYVRAQAVTESNWIQSVVGDGGDSFGLLQVRSSAHAGTFPTSRDSTAFNVDYTLAARRSCYEGDITWLNTVEHSGTYAAGDEWGCAGVWYSGRWMTSDATYYIGVMKGHLANKPWLQSGF